MTAKPPTASGVMTDSVPPAIAASASPYWIIRYASPMAWAPVVQAVDGREVRALQAVLDRDVARRPR